MDSLGQHTDLEHHTYGARGLMVGPLTVHQETPVRFRSRTPFEFTEPGRVFDAIGHVGFFPSVAHLVEHSIETRGVVGSIPARGTDKKRKR